MLQMPFSVPVITSCIRQAASESRCGFLSSREEWLQRVKEKRRRRLASPPLQATKPLRATMEGPWGALVLGDAEEPWDALVDKLVWQGSDYSLTDDYKDGFKQQTEESSSPFIRGWSTS